jgi:hypothetical protein
MNGCSSHDTFRKQRQRLFAPELLPYNGRAMARRQVQVGFFHRGIDW